MCCSSCTRAMTKRVCGFHSITTGNFSLQSSYRGHFTCLCSVTLLLSPRMGYRTHAPEVPRDNRPEFQHPSPDGLVADRQLALRQQILDIAVAQGEAQVEPNRVPDHIAREAVAGVGDRLHAQG